MKKTVKIVQEGFAVIFFFTIISVIVRSYIKFNPVKTTLSIISGIIFTAAVVFLFIFIKKKVRAMTRKKTDRLFFCISGAVLTLQLISAFALKFDLINDLQYVDNAARDFCLSWDKSNLYLHLPDYHYGYFARYTNNQALLLIVSFIYRVCYKLTDTMPVIIPILINTAGLHISYILMYFTAKKIFKDKVTPLYCAVIGAGFSVFYTYTPFFYTDSMSMPFVMGTIYLFLCGIEQKNIKIKAVQLIFSGLLLAVSFKIKGNAIILIPAFLLYIAVMLKKENRKKMLSTACIFVISSSLSLYACGAFIDSFNIADEKELDETQFPSVHWVMMGLRDRGGYCEQDFYFTKDSGNYEQKKEADIEEIKNRLADYGITGMIKHLAKKVSYTWGDGTYMIAYYIKNKQDTNILSRFLTKSMWFKFLCSVYQCMLLVTILFSYIYSGISGKISRDILPRIIICGIYFFLILWETRSRYLINLTPLFIITASYSIKSAAFITEKYLKRRKTAVIASAEKAADSKENIM